MYLGDPLKGEKLGMPMVYVTLVYSRARHVYIDGMLQSKFPVTGQ